MERKIIITEDGSHTLFVPELEEHFHSIHGAIQESMHVFIQNGLKNCRQDEINILEVGFGTGLNALLTLSHRSNKVIRYFSIEKYPLQTAEYEQLNYIEKLGSDLHEAFLTMHGCPWEKTIEIVPGFYLTKINVDLQEFDFQKYPPFDLIYFDAFAPGKQPEMWQENIFRNMAEHTANNGIFVTYCAKGEIRRSLTRCGYTMTRLPGPPGKKEMLIGQKLQA